MIPLMCILKKACTKQSLHSCRHKNELSVCPHLTSRDRKLQSNIKEERKYIANILIEMTWHKVG